LSSKPGSMCPPGKTVKEAIRRIYYVAGEKLGITKTQLGVTPHGLRHEYANDKSEAVSGNPSVVRGGSSILDRALDEKARHQCLGVLARPQMRRVVNAAREHEVIGLQSSDLDPLLHGITGRWRDLELDGTLGLVLHHDRSSGDLFAVADVPDLEGNEVTTAELAVDSKVEECEFADPIFHLKADSKCPDVLGLEWRLLANDLALVPWLAMSGVRYGSHGLPSS
jgi:hypothetical protein